MPALTSMLRSYAIIGLLPSERSLLESILALPTPRGLVLTKVQQPGQAELLVVNGDDAAVVERVRLAHPHALLVLVGRPDKAEGVTSIGRLPALRRSFDVLGVHGVIDALPWSKQPLFPVTPPEVSKPGGKVSPHKRSDAKAPINPADFARTTASAPLSLRSGIISAGLNHPDDPPELAAQSPSPKP